MPLSPTRPTDDARCAQLRPAARETGTSPSKRRSPAATSNCSAATRSTTGIGRRTVVTPRPWTRHVIDVVVG